MSSTDRVPGTTGEAKADRPSLLDRMRSLFGLSAASIRDDIEDALDDTSTTGDFTPQERAMLKNVLGLHELRVQDVMVPRADIIAVGLEDSLGDVLAVFRTAGHSRLPVHGETLDDPRGMVHIRDFVDYIANSAENFLKGATPAPPSEDENRQARRQAIVRLRGMGELDLMLPLSKAGVVRPVLFVPPSMPALDLLVKMQATRTHMALVIDEYGGTDGLVSIEDIVEMIVGDIEDEHDEDDHPKIDAAPDGSWIADARASLEDLSAAIGVDLESIYDEEDVDTLGGLVTTIAGRVPVRGEIVVSSGRFEFEILDADPRRVKRVRLRSLDVEHPPQDDGGRARAGSATTSES
ncbi:MAG: hemolysin family protein [Beijerinckiaceae bacterium]|nr:hemolysin family protein [Beijerinckiaceae bacterium]MBX9759642.1 hemolysin family protein [Beijerinckiaceae bacterium]MDO9441904.1 hemolysin family protein [Beijerinckiaceae bacterium]